MAKRFIISEEERSDIRSRYGLVNEQSEDAYKAIKGVQCFLNKKGFKVQITGDINSETKKAIQNFQTKAKLSPANGNWNDTVNNLTPQDTQLFKQCLADEGDFIDKGINWLSKLF
jgi:hypothetical protein